MRPSLARSVLVFALSLWGPLAAWQKVREPRAAPTRVPTRARRPLVTEPTTASHHATTPKAPVTHVAAKAPSSTTHPTSVHSTTTSTTHKTISSAKTASTAPAKITSAASPTNHTTSHRSESVTV